MKITRLETFLTHAGLRNYLFLRLSTDTGLTGLGEASLEWQERAVACLLHDWVEERILGIDPFDRDRVISDLIRDQYQGGPTILTAISGVEIALWDLIGKASRSRFTNYWAAAPATICPRMQTGGTAEHARRMILQPKPAT